MKTKILALLIILLCSCSTETKEQKIERLGYNYEKDSYIDSILKVKPKGITKGDNFVILRYDEVEIDIVYHEFTPFQQPESWSFYCTTFEGRTIVIQSFLNLAQNKISKQTMDKLKQIYLATKK